LLADRTPLEQKPASDRSVFLVADKGGEIELPSVTLRARRDRGPLPDDFTMRNGLSCMSMARALLENMHPSRARRGAARTLKPSEVEARIEVMSQGVV
jgi:hypothetical protein